MKAVSKEKIRELDHTAIWEYKIPSIVLMENAGAGASHIIVSSIEREKNVVIFCGKGNNGGDGFVIARHLHNNYINVHVFFIGDLDEIDVSSDPGINMLILKNMGINIIEIPSMTEFKTHHSFFLHCDCVIDAIFGTGLTREVKNPIATMIQEINSWQKKVFAIDIPSGMDANNGEILGVAIKASETITFALPKKGFYLNEGSRLVGKLHVVDISIPRNLIEKAMNE